MADNAVSAPGTPAAAAAENAPATSSDSNVKNPTGSNNKANNAHPKRRAKKEKKVKVALKTAKGTRDISPAQMQVRAKAFRIIGECFRRHGGQQIDTPVFELKETLTSKYGEDTKLIYDLADQGGEILALRYDLTVPFARYCAMNRVTSMKRYQFGRVYRRDQCRMESGRYREFYQCDFDIAGEADPMVADAELLKIAVEVLTQLDLGAFKIKINNRELIDGMFEVAGVPQELYRPICSAVDKLDKMPWADVKKEMLEKGLEEAIADKIEPFVKQSGNPKELVKSLIESGSFDSSASAKKCLGEMSLLFDYLEAYGVVDAITFDLSLARGLDYYTGVIMEAILVDEGQVGSIAGGGRYDELVGMFSGNKSIPCVGFSVGIERVFNILEKREKAKNGGKDLRGSSTDVYVVSMDDGLVLEKMKLLKMLWDNNVKAEMLNKTNPKARPQLNAASKTQTPFTVIMKKEDLEKGVVQLKDMTAGDQVEVALDGLVAALNEKLGSK
eukprot:TRINITY_DN6580_c0_g1_i1.p1 TRINITY_DN6580_c0_g1~~TRINITY_DN6580_c0_g1_i1.p1  ORF type:complete len:501 (-),score=159.49 TRINITY_DN6580_c0_g1_i1:61-1563(-)